MRVDGTITVYYYKPIFIMYQKWFRFVFVWCPCMAINVLELSVQHNGVFFPGVVVDPIMLLPSGNNPFQCHKEVLQCSR